MTFWASTTEQASRCMVLEGAAARLLSRRRFMDGNANLLVHRICVNAGFGGCFETGRSRDE